MSAGLDVVLVAEPGTTRVRERGSLEPARLLVLELGTPFRPSTGDSITDENEVEGERRYWSGVRTVEAEDEDTGGRDVEER